MVPQRRPFRRVEADPEWSTGASPWFVDGLAATPKLEPEPSEQDLAVARELLLLRDAAPPVLVRAVGGRMAVVRGRALVAAAAAAGVATLPVVDLDRCPRPKAWLDAWKTLEVALSTPAGYRRAIEELERAAGEGLGAEAFLPVNRPGRR